VSRNHRCTIALTSQSRRRLPWRGDLAGWYHSEMRHRLLTLLIALALGPPLIAIEWWYWKESSLALLLLQVVGLYVVLWLLWVILWLLARMCDALCQLIGVKPRGVPTDDSNSERTPKCSVSRYATSCG